MKYLSKEKLKLKLQKLKSRVLFGIVNQSKVIQNKKKRKPKYPETFDDSE